MAPSVPRSMQYQATNVPLPTAASNFPAFQLFENTPPLLPPFAPNSSLPLVSQWSTALDKSAVMFYLSDKLKTVFDLIMPFKGMPDSVSSNTGTTSAVLSELQHLFMSSQTAQKDVGLFMGYLQTRRQHMHQHYCQQQALHA